jgi:hypothetical protein
VCFLGFAIVELFVDCINFTHMFFWSFQMLTKLLAISVLPIAILAGAVTFVASAGKCDSTKSSASASSCCSCCVDCTNADCACELLDCKCDQGGACLCDSAVTTTAASTTVSTTAAGQKAACDCCDNCTNPDCVCESVGCQCDAGGPCACDVAAKPSCSSEGAKSCCGRGCCDK